MCNFSFLCSRSLQPFQSYPTNFLMSFYCISQNAWRNATSVVVREACNFEGLPVSADNKSIFVINPVEWRRHCLLLHVMLWSRGITVAILNNIIWVSFENRFRSWIAQGTEQNEEYLYIYIYIWMGKCKKDITPLHYSNGVTSFLH